ncbi:hypothetical protein V6N13_104809 [Hibiscus sabdariffa]
MKEESFNENRKGAVSLQRCWPQTASKRMMDWTRGYTIQGGQLEIEGYPDRIGSDPRKLKELFGAPRIYEKEV